MKISSRFATQEEIFSDDFEIINRQLMRINAELRLVDHSEINKQRFRWSDKIKEKPVFYASRFWEYPFSILSAELKHGMKCADIGCGTTPFTPYLCAMVGKENVTGFDPDHLENKNQNSHYAFGTREDFIQKAGFNFQPDNMTLLNAPDESFDRVFCVSVIEHIEEPAVWQKGIREMTRILKPGGRLIITVDLGINCPLINPLDIIKHSGLIPVSHVEFNWPTHRFVNFGTDAMDVFGLVLEKSTRSIFTDDKGKTNIPEYKANKKFIPPFFTTGQTQIGKDLKRKGGRLIILIKLLLGKYK